jgi:hypothetical protein
MRILRSRGTGHSVDDGGIRRAFRGVVLIAAPGFDIL